MATTHKSSISGKPYEGFGNNAWPFSGRCSDEDNFLYVLPARFNNWTPGLVKRLGGNKKAAAFIDEHCSRTREQRLADYHREQEIIAKARAEYEAERATA